MIKKISADNKNKMNINDNDNDINDSNNMNGNDITCDFDVFTHTDARAVTFLISLMLRRTEPMLHRVFACVYKSGGDLIS